MERSLATAEQTSGKDLSVIPRRPDSFLSDSGRPPMRDFTGRCALRPRMHTTNLGTSIDVVLLPLQFLREEQPRFIAFSDYVPYPRPVGKPRVRPHNEQRTSGRCILLSARGSHSINWIRHGHIRRCGGQEETEYHSCDAPSCATLLTEQTARPVLLVIGPSGSSPRGYARSLTSRQMWQEHVVRVLLNRRVLE